MVLIGLGSIYADYASHGGIDLIDDHFGVVLCASIVGMLLCAVSLVAWAKQLHARGRAKVGAITSLMSGAVCITAATIGGTNVHGPLFLLCLLIFPMFLVGIVLWLSAAFSKS